MNAVLHFNQAMRRACLTNKKMIFGLLKFDPHLQFLQLIETGPL